MRTVSILCLLGLAPCALAQSLCASDDTPALALQVLERFTSADCEACWDEAQKVAPSADTLVLDWVVPTAAGMDAPLGPGAHRDALHRLQSLQAANPAGTWQHTPRVHLRTDLRLRVAHGLPVANYVGTGLTLSPALPGPWTAYLLLVEKMPVRQTNGPTFHRHLVRNALVVDWTDPLRSTDEEAQAWREARPMSIPEGARYERLYALAWVQDAQGRVVALARSDCV